MRTTFFFLSLTLLFLFNAKGQKKQPDLKQFDRFVEEAFKEFHPEGLAVAVIKGDKIVYSKGFGVRNKETGEKITPQTLFNIASCSKAFTAASIALLVESGQLNWDDKVIDHVPEFQLADPYITRELAVRDLLCHRSGLGTFYGDLLWYGTQYTDKEVIQRMRYLPLTNDFRSEFGYQNNMYLLAGEIILRVTGKTWSEFVTEKFFQPLGMDQSRPSNDELEPGQEVARGHFHGKLLPEYDFNATKPAASIFSSVEDLSHWTQMLLNKGLFNENRMLQQASLREMFSAQTVMRPSFDEESNGIHFKTYGMGWKLFDYGGRKIVEHDGGMPGFISKVTLVPEEQLAVIVLNNGMDFYINSVIRYQLLDQYFEQSGHQWISEYAKVREMNNGYEASFVKRRESSRISGTQPSLEPKGYAGMYEDKMYGKAEVSMEAGSLILSLLPAKALFTGKMEHWHHDTYKVQFKDELLPYALVTFEFDVLGAVSGFKIDLPNGDFHFFNLHFIAVPPTRK